MKRFRSHKVAALLAYLALHLDQPCPREALYDALWPEEEPAAVANRFRVTLASLRRQLEPESVSFGTVLDVSEPGRVRLRAEMVGCDLVDFDRLCRAGQKEEVVLLANGTLLPGFYEDARPDFVFSARHAEAVVEICKRIEGIPLALELAAARITAQTPQQIAESLLTQLTHLKSRQRGLTGLCLHDERRLGSRHRVLLAGRICIGRPCRRPGEFCTAP